MFDDFIRVFEPLRLVIRIGLKGSETLGNY
jgi:hypothetical protein